MRQVSWDEAFAERYAEWSAEMTADIPFYVELARQADGPLVELAIGTGRVAIPVAQATGQRVIGIDSSPTMLAQARTRAAFDHQAGARIDGTHREKPLPHTIRYAVGDNRIGIILDGGGTTSLWWATRNEWLGLLDVAGLELEALYGGFAGEPFGDGSREYVFVARRSGDGS